MSSRISIACAPARARATSIGVAATLASLLLVACASSAPNRAPPQTSNETVPANSVSEERLKGNEQPGAPKPIASTQEDPTQPMVTSMSAGPAPAPKEEPKAAPAKGGGGKVSKAECDKLYDRVLELQIASDPRLAGAGPEVIAMAKQMGKEKHGEAPCEATRSQYNCAVNATSVAKWKSCLK